MNNTPARIVCLPSSSKQQNNQRNKLNRYLSTTLTAKGIAKNNRGRAAGALNNNKYTGVDLTIKVHLINAILSSNSRCTAPGGKANNTALGTKVATLTIKLIIAVRKIAGLELLATCGALKNTTCGNPCRAQSTSRQRRRSFHK